ncbi:unnamed protein product [Caretta caretta]
MPTNKSPGMDGLTVEFYRAFWDILGPDLVTVWAESLQSGVLPLSCRRAMLALLPKKRDLRNLRNWRPVSLLSTDYKIVAKAISLRLGSVMADMIHPDQTYTVLGRSIFDNLFLVQDLLELGRRDGLSFALLSLDQEKVFGRVDRGYLLGTLQGFGFGPQFVSFLRVLYASAECLVRFNCTLTKPVSFGRGVRQECPLSGQLYALAIEPFLCFLCRRLTGLVLREPELWLVLSAYADDVLLVVQDPGHLALVEACQAIYSAASSTRVNWVKSSGLAVGDWQQELEEFQNFVENNPPYDIVIDGLNVANVSNKRNQSQTLLDVVFHLAQQNLRLLVLGRKHMLTGSHSWKRHIVAAMQKKADFFFAENVSEDDPFLLYATLHSGSHCKFLTRDLLRDHKACIPDSLTRYLFFKWQRGHQMVLSHYWPGKRIKFQPILTYDTVVQTTGDTWHIPYDEQLVERYSYEVPTKWLCLQRK